MSKGSLEFGPDIAAAIRAHGAETYPHECCGALIAHSADRESRDDADSGVRHAMVVTNIVPLPNTTEEGPRRRFLVRPSDYRLAEKTAAELGGELLGFYHSHPDHPARPSQYDLDHAWPTFAYVIVSVQNGVGREMTVWFLADDRSAFTEGILHHGDDNPDSHTPAAVHGEA
jgi:proteasome lid subunit RPN8/RPN11